jgi:tRNA threonylcarbamoyladenosine biosynthesis protein TsaE
MSIYTTELIDASDTRDLGLKLGKCLPAGSVLLLTGNLGSGKTTLVQGLAEGLGIDEQIVSPTFTIINEYLTGRIPLYHLDLYRLTSQEVDALNLDNYWDGIEVEPGIVAIEWSERMPYKPPHYIHIDLHDNADRGRIAKIDRH